MPPLDTGQAPCVHCDRPLLLVDHVSERLVARERFLHDAVKASREQSAFLSCLSALGALIFIAAVFVVVGYAIYAGIAAGFGE